MVNQYLYWLHEMRCQNLETSFFQENLITLPVTERIYCAFLLYNHILNFIIFNHIKNWFEYSNRIIYFKFFLIFLQFISSSPIYEIDLLYSLQSISMSFSMISFLFILLKFHLPYSQYICYFFTINFFLLFLCYNFSSCIKLFNLL